MEGNALLSLVSASLWGGMSHPAGTVNVALFQSYSAQAYNGYGSDVQLL